jgi:hypothetical protein
VPVSFYIVLAGLLAAQVVIVVLMLENQRLRKRVMLLISQYRVMRDYVGSLQEELLRSRRAAVSPRPPLGVSPQYVPGDISRHVEELLRSKRAVAAAPPSPEQLAKTRAELIRLTRQLTDDGS